MMKIFKILVSLFLIICTISPSFAFGQQTYTMMEIREIQNHYFETTNVNAVLKAAINTLQDNGFIIQNVEDQLGYITAKKELKARRTDHWKVARSSAACMYCGALSICSLGILSPLLISPVKSLKNELSLHPTIVQVNISVDRVGKRTKVRLSFVEKVFEIADGSKYTKPTPKDIRRYYDRDIYQTFFRQMDKSIFIEQIK